MIILSLGILWFFSADTRRSFTCRAQLAVELSFSQCDSRNLLDLFIAMNGDGEGYLMLSGKTGCQDKTVVANDILDFDKESEERVYDLHVRKKLR
ncbi:hypothetical protein AAFN90_19615 [Erwiniaceae bacterium CAU 1747]